MTSKPNFLLIHQINSKLTVNSLKTIHFKPIVALEEVIIILLHKFIRAHVLESREQSLPYRSLMYTAQCIHQQTYLKRRTQYEQMVM